MGIAQTEFLDAVLGLKAEHLELGKFIDHGLRLVRDSRLNRYTLGSDLAQVLIGRLRRTESLELAIERVVQLLNEPEPAPGPKEEYHRSDGRNTLAEFGLLAYVKLSDYDTAIDFFKTQYVDRDTEVSLLSCCNGCVRSSAKIFGSANMKELSRQVSSRATVCQKRTAILSLRVNSLGTSRIKS